MISAFSNTLKIPELRQRIFFTLAMVVIVRIGAAITLPGVNATSLQAWVKGISDDATSGGAAVAALLNVFSGGGLTNCAIFALGIMPYISASIMMQLLTAVVPRLSKLAREDGGRQKINTYTRVAAIILSVVQGYMLALSLEDPSTNIFLRGFDEGKFGTLVPDPGWMFRFICVITITAGTMLLMWLGEQMTERGIGNGISLIITVNIISALPGALVQVWKTYVVGEDITAAEPLKLVALVALLLFVIGSVIAVTQAARRITIQYAKRVVGRKVLGGGTNYMPLKVNYAGVMPIIFAQAILIFPGQIINMAFPGQQWASDLAQTMATGWPNYVISTLLIFFFSYFWVATMFQPQQIADDLKKNGGYIPGVRPGKSTADFLDYTMGRLTFAGALFLTLIFLIPQILTLLMKVPPMAAQFFGGTSILILVGVLLDIMRQVETHLLQRHYDGFLRKGKIRGRFDRQRAVGGRISSSGSMVYVYVLIGALIICGMSIFLYYQIYGD